MTRITVAGVLEQEYRFSDTANNGRITQKKDWVSEEEVSYQYDVSVRRTWPASMA